MSTPVTLCPGEPLPVGKSILTCDRLRPLYLRPETMNHLSHQRMERLAIGKGWFFGAGGVAGVDFPENVPIVAEVSQVRDIGD